MLGVAEQELLLTVLKIFLTQPWIFRLWGGLLPHIPRVVSVELVHNHMRRIHRDL